MTVEVTFAEQSGLFATTFADTIKSFVSNFDSFVEGTTADLPKYDGACHLKPKCEEQVIPTANTYLLEDITIEPIPLSEVSNAFGGTTVTIG